MWYIIGIIIIIIVISTLLYYINSNKSYNSQNTSTIHCKDTLTFTYSESAEIDPDWKVIGFHELVDTKVMVDLINKIFYFTENVKNHKWAIISEILTLPHNGEKNIDFKVLTDEGIPYEIMIRGNSKMIIYCSTDQIKIIYGKKGVLHIEKEEASR